MRDLEITSSAFQRNKKKCKLHLATTPQDEYCGGVKLIHSVQASIMYSRRCVVWSKVFKRKYLLQL